MGIASKHVVSSNGTVGEDGVRQYTVIWHVHTEDKNDQALSATDFSEALLYISTYSVGNDSDPQAVCVGVDAERRPDSMLDWDVTVTYSSKPFAQGQTDITSGGDTGGLPTDPGQGNNQVTPTSRPWLIKFGSAKTTRLLTEDYTTPTPKKAVNTAGVPFDPPLEVASANPTITITAFKSVFYFSQIPFYTDAINSGSFLGFNARTLRVTEYTADSQYENGAYVWTLNITMEVKYDGWNPVKVLDAGAVEKNSEGELVAIIDRQGQAVTEPVPLNGVNGRRLTVGSPLQYIDFKPYREVNFSGLV